MIPRTCRLLIGSLVLISITVPAVNAKVSPEDAARLGKELTPLGAIQRGNATGTIPAWEGGIQQPVPGYRPGMHHPDPFPNDQPISTITAANVDQYTEKLSPGQVAMLKRYPKSWQMNIYQTRRFK